MHDLRLAYALMLALAAASCGGEADEPEVVDDSAEAMIAICEETRECAEATCEAEWLTVQEHSALLDDLDESQHDQWAEDLDELVDEWELCNAPCYSHPSWPDTDNACDELVAMYNDGYVYDPVECAEGRGLQTAFGPDSCADRFASWPS